MRVTVTFSPRVKNIIKPRMIAPNSHTHRMIDIPTVPPRVTPTRRACSAD
jgi:hypothetical protein